MLDGPRPRLRQVGDLMGVPNSQVPGAGQVRAAPAGARREMRDHVIGLVVPRQVRPRRPRPLAGLTADAARAALRRLFPGRSSVLGGIEEFPLLRETCRSSRAIFSACSASCALSSEFSA